jgi:predicted aspartyl protease
VNGIVDDRLRALLHVPVSASGGGNRTTLAVWIDTAFNGAMAIPLKQIAELGLVEESTAEAVLADGHTVESETFACHLDWFDKSYRTQVVANDGEFPLLGTMLLVLQRQVSQWVIFGHGRQRTYVGSILPNFTHGAVVLDGHHLDVNYKARTVRLS